MAEDNDSKVVTVDIEKLLFDLQNPRFSSLADQRDALHALCSDGHAKKTVLLAESIAEDGLNPAELIMVIRGERRGHYIVLEGNRRLAALKLLAVPARAGDSPLSKPFQSRIRKSAQVADQSDFRRVPCRLLPTREEANFWISLKHTGENEGVGVVSWNGEEAARFRGSDPGYKLLDYVRANATLSDAAKQGMLRFPVTNLDRLLGDPDVRKALGISIERGTLLMTHPAEKVLRAVTKVVEDIARRDIRVNAIKSKSDRAEYLAQINDFLISGEPLACPTDLTGKPLAAGNNSCALPKPIPVAPRARNLPNSDTRKTVIPKSCVIPIDIQRINDVFRELRTLNVDDFPNAASALLRIFIDTTTTEYVEKISVSVKKNEIGQSDIKPRIDAAIQDFILKTGYREQGNAAKSALLLVNGMIPIEQLHMNLHGRFTHPMPDNLRFGWNQIEPWMKGMWTILEGLASPQEKV